ncbi:hypothetical protein BDQ17DRAFT_1401499 [Cyathus striatus]|nr:hypothetical protein BDQ17DRAFT_1401499 [Cyathus striatus]
MSRRGGNNVRGPTSALTSFLQAQGITAATIARRVQQNGGQDQNANANANGAQADQQPSEPLSLGLVMLVEAMQNIASLVGLLSAKKRAKAMKRGGGSEYEESDDEDDEEFIPKVGGRSLWAAGTGASSRGSNAASGSKPPVGSLGNCAECEKQFTFTKYTLANASGDGYLCHPCAKASGNDPFEERRFPTLVSICIDIVSKHIEDIEAFGDIGMMNVEAIAKALSKNRCLTPQNAPLFYNVITTHSPMAPSLQRIELLGPFLVRVEAWKDFFRAHRDLQGFLITQSPRFDVDCARPQLRLKEIGLISDAMLNTSISATLVIRGVHPEAIEALVKKFFEAWTNPPLKKLSVSRNPELASAALAAAVDVGWVRAMNDFIVKEWLDGNEQRGAGGLKALKEVKVWGCNRITERCPRKQPKTALRSIRTSNLNHN